MNLKSVYHLILTKITPSSPYSSYYSSRQAIPFDEMLDSMPPAISSKDKQKYRQSTDKSHCGVEYNKEDGVPRRPLAHLISKII